MPPSEDFRRRAAAYAAARQTKQPEWRETPRPGAESQSAPPRRGRVRGALLGLVLAVPVLAGGGYAALTMGGGRAGPLDLKGMVYSILHIRPDAWTLLPQAPGDWITITPEDAVGDDPQAAIAQLAARWPGGEAELRAHPYFQTMAGYLDQQGKAGSPLTVDLMTTRRPKTKGSVLYAHTGGGLVVAGIELLREDGALGVPDVPATWTEALLQWRDRTAPPGTETAPLELAGLPAITVSGGVGEGPGIPVFEPGGFLPNAYSLDVAVNARAILTLRGYSPGTMPEMLVRALDTQAVDGALDLLTSKATVPSPVESGS